MKSTPILATFGLFAALSAQAAPVSSFGNLEAGWGVGSGQPNGGFAISKNVSPEIELGLRSQDYQVGPSANNGIDTYYVAPGERSPGSGLANWNLDLSVYTYESVIAPNWQIFLDIDWDPTAGTNLITYDLDALLSSIAPSVTLYQASENLGFAYWGMPSFDENALGTYQFTLRAYDNNNPTELAASTTIFIQVGQQVPEPGSLALAGVALAGLMLGRRRA
jgi:PEP-CTERM motif